ncbi:ABC transporter ATP-binding protein [Variovorax sp. NFACC27]|uniref:ABC transporter ATP-binding protein n=1 Tax=Variovorax gossypii TaxID=1679495 RepID=A0A3S0H0M2_9BURK|nr:MULTISPECIES: ABC transporter ATP-binding protein [Variovorax]MDP9600531.1 ABC-type nitrate/sulfonate/bicarbonate transport system ATPase subunit [Variovorax paradoxus]SEF29830.1 ABC-type nitrate/sulfonate/bicarbonate transport system, ATPase component [Variovorax sp. NFACC28]SEG85844.1 ABC-type nitrate/sulfonate/bicarbonate transport system, ATPase component [Variovorax sp. NFACC29]SFD22046.1 ABC-type nitrate/sulfonate/bicarbonate transport system, ATPase component [Variovorax sp. NFACC26]
MKFMPHEVMPPAASDTAPPMLELVNVWKRFGEAQARTVAVSGVNLRIAKGEFVTLVGPSGCGKSTLFNMIAGLLPPDDDGSLLFGGVPQRDGQLLGKVSFMPQRDLLFPWRTVLDNAILALEVEGLPRKEARERARAMLPEFGLAGFANHYPHQLSGGMRQRVALMRTFLFERDLMLLDEPFGALDALTRSRMQHWLLDIWARHWRTVLFITHDIDEAIVLGDRVLVMSARPGTVKSETVIDLPRPRDPSVVLTPEFIRIKQRLLAEIEEESRKTFAQEGTAS